MSIQELKERRNAALAKARALLGKVEANPGDTAAAADLRQALHESDRLKIEVEEAELRTIDPSQRIQPQGDRPTEERDDSAIKLTGAGLRYFAPGESIRASLPSGLDDPDLRKATVGDAVVSLLKGEKRAQSMAADASGGYFLNDVVAAGFIDRTRTFSALDRAGVPTIAFDRPESETMSFVTLETDPTPYWRAEEVAITESSATFGKLTARPRVVGCLVKISEELAMSSPNAAQSIETALSRAMALEIDRACLLGDGHNEPTGLLNSDGITTTAFGGLGPAADDFLNWAAVIEEVNGPLLNSLAMVMTPALYSAFRKYKDGSGAYLADNMPTDFQAMRKVRSNQLRSDRGSGSTTEAVVFSPADTAFIMRQRVKIELGRTGDDFGKLLMSIRAWCMVDILPFKPAFIHHIDDILV